MEGIKLLIVIFGLLFIVERKPMNILFNFIGLVVTVAILLGQSAPFGAGMDYLSYLLIIIYCSALTIIFGFVIMLTPISSTPTSAQAPNLKWGLAGRGESLLIPFLCALAITVTALIFNYNHPFEIIGISDMGVCAGEGLENKDTPTEGCVINKIGNLLYTEEINIIKFMIATLILFFALVALFFVLMPTIPL